MENTVLKDLAGNILDPKIPRYENFGAITTRLVEMTTIESTSTPTKLKLGSGTVNTNPNLFEISDDGGVKVLKDGTYEVSGQVYFGTNNKANDNLCAVVYKNNSITQFSTANYGGMYVDVQIAPMIINASANDIFYLAGENTTRTGGDINNNNARTYLTVKKVV